MRLEWSHDAAADRMAVFDYIEFDNPAAAAANDKRISKHVGRLAEFPEIGRMGRVQGTRELVIPNTPYIAVYRINANGVLLLRILHAAQHWLDRMA